MYYPRRNKVERNVCWSSKGKSVAYAANNFVNFAYKIVPESLEITEAAVLLKKVHGEKFETFTNESGERIDEHAVFKNINPEITKKFGQDCIII